MYEIEDAKKFLNWYSKPQALRQVEKILDSPEVAYFDSLLDKWKAMTGASHPQEGLFRKIFHEDRTEPIPTILHHLQCPILESYGSNENHGRL